ncbi:type II secretion system F family protein [Mumia sp. ZJ1417]|uniref:type II secretion system F family protein n=1 Tax=Mumia sp. ZJ1417 TaxID=2708082 RepID=UPI0014209FF8|nr:type II secretion system F family protein [Mumia sp. ZJ1417]QMW66706.1 type II secretion system F family protein [Mumia sp. ZJ1417]
MSAGGSWAVAAMLLAAFGTWLGAGPSGSGRIVPRAFEAAGAVRSRPRASWVWLVGAIAVVVLAWWGVSFVAIAVVSGVVAVVARLRARGRRRADGRRLHAEIAGACEALASELASGSPASLAIDRVARDFVVLATVASHARLGGDVVTALRAASTAPGAEGLRDVAAAWSVSARSGASQAAILDRVAEMLRERDDLLREVDAALGSPRATARLLAVLPVLALALGVALGGDPLGFLLGGGLGSWCLAGGAALAVAGVLWVERLTESAAR